MKKRLIRTTIVLVCFFLAVGILIAYLGTLPSHDDFSYEMWASQAHYSTPYNVDTDTSDVLPTRDQIIAWKSYLIWRNCYQYHDVQSCQELTD